jgi:tetratricopeptide (TPR) repeat protein
MSAAPIVAAAQPTSSPAAQVADLFARAQAAYARGDKIGAHDAYKAAWALQRSYDIAGNLGNLELKLGRNRDAAEHLTFALEDFPPTGDPAQRKAVEKRLAEALKEIGRLRIRVNVDGASVTVNGASIGEAPFPRAVFVEPGTVIIEAKLAGYVGGRQTINVGKGDDQEVKLALVAERRGPSIGLVIGGSVTAAVGVGAGIGLLVAGAGKASDADKLAAQGKAAGLSCASPPQAGKCQALHDANAASDTLHNAAIPVLVVGAAFAAATVTYALWPRRAPERSAGTAVMPVVSPGFGGFVMSGRF